MKSARNRLSRAAPLALSLIALALFAAWEYRGAIAGFLSATHAPLRNYGVVWPGRLTRSGMPYDDSGWEWLRRQGTKSIVDFRMRNAVDYKEFGFEHVLLLPLTKSPTMKQAATFLKFIQDPENPPVHIHCAAGRDRTGMMTVLVRYAIDGWPLEKALAEAKSFRGGDDLAPARIEWLEEWAAKHKPGSFRLKQRGADASRLGGGQ